MPAVPRFIQNEICAPQVTEINECLQSGLFNGLLPFFLLFYVLKLYWQGFFVSLHFMQKKGLFYAHVLPEDAISCKMKSCSYLGMRSKKWGAGSCKFHGAWHGPGPKAARPGCRSQPSQTSSSSCAWIFFLGIRRGEGRLKVLLLDPNLTCNCTVARMQPQIWKLESTLPSHSCRYLLQP